ncbi:MAG: hypothetical protein GXP54_08555 [Deltaproteobacteria bacterium]|nr:hypothetical protein [Deltaproteobacteria bacterium]
MRSTVLKDLTSVMLLVLFAVLPLGNRALGEGADTSQAVATDAQAAGSRKAVGLNLDLELSSLYCFRGINVFQESSQTDQNFLWAPSFTWDVFETGLWFGYWGAYQGRGGNKAALVAAGVGHESDFIIGFNHEIIEGTLTLKTSLTWYVFPFASSGVAGTDLPSYLEPALGLDWTGPVDLGITISYFAGIQKALSDFRYLYIHPTISKTFEFNDHVGLAIGLGFGYKLFNDRGKMTDNVYDVQFDWSIPVRITKEFYLEPAFHAAWTNLAGKGVGEEYLVWAGLNMGVDI